MRLVFFDFDRTLTTRDTIIPLGLLLARESSRPAFNAVRLLWAMLLLKGRVLSNHQFKERFSQSLLKGETEQRIGRLSRSFASGHIAGRLNRNVVQKLREHRKRGDEIYIVSSNFSFLLDVMKDQLNADGVIATELEVADGRYTGKLSGPACAGPEKLSRVVARFGHERVAEAVAYGDSADDRCLLQSVSTPVWV